MPTDNRRSFLRQLAGLPLIGGGITIIGAPSAVAEPLTLELLSTYKTWLFYEHRMVSIEMANGDSKLGHQLEGYIECNKGDRFFFGDVARYRTAPPSGRAALVLSAVGCDWREG